MLFSLVEECAQRDLPIVLDGPIVGRVDVGDPLLVEQGLENGRANGAGHAGERKDVDDPVEVLVGILDRRAYAERRLGAYRKVEEAVVVEVALDGGDPVIRLDIE